MGEFALIREYFKNRFPQRGVSVGIGDDAAVIDVSDLQSLHVSVDSYHAGTHFFSDDSPQNIATKTFRSSISDLLAMGATPKMAVLAMRFPKAEPTWLAAFSDALLQDFNEYGVSLIGGDATAGELSLTYTVFGSADRAILRSGAQVGDLLYLSGPLGQAAFELEAIENNTLFREAANAFYRPSLPINLIPMLQKHATACIDVSDGLLQDLKHLMTASDVGAHVMLDRLPLGASLKPIEQASAWRFALTGGDDYQLLFTAPQGACIQNAYCIGEVTSDKNLTLTERGKPVSLELVQEGYDHFSD